MTNLDRRGVRRETNALDPVKRRKVLCVMLEAGGKLVRIKVKGDRRWYTATYEQIYRMAIHNRAQELRREKAERREERKKARDS